MNERKRKKNEKGRYNENIQRINIDLMLSKTLCLNRFLHFHISSWDRSIHLMFLIILGHFLDYVETLICMNIIFSLKLVGYDFCYTKIVLFNLHYSVYFDSIVDLRVPIILVPATATQNRTQVQFL